jgi:hypothetical protein
MKRKSERWLLKLDSTGFLLLFRQIFVSSLEGISKMEILSV